MITLEFRADEYIFAEEGKADLLAANAAVLQVTSFLVPVRLNVNGVELLELPPRQGGVIWASRPGQVGLEPMPADSAASPWLELPLLEAATSGLDKVRQAAGAGSSVYYLGETGGSLSFEVSGGDVMIRCNLNGRTGHVDYNELLRAWERFAHHVRVALTQQWPELKRHAVWGGWFAEAH